MFHAQETLTQHSAQCEFGMQWQTDASMQEERLQAKVEALVCRKEEMEFKTGEKIPFEMESVTYLF